jgi:hypothetical protein
MSIAKTNTILASGYNLASALKSVSPSGSSQDLDATYLSSGFRVYEAGFQTAEVSAEGFFNSDSVNLDKIHNILSAAYSARTTQILTAFLQDYAFGGDCVMLDACIMNYAVPVEVNSVIMSNAKWRSQNGLWFGKGYLSQASSATTITSTAVDGGAASTAGALLHAHLDNNAATSVAVKIQHSVDGVSSWADLVNVTSMTGASYDSGTASVAVGTTIRRYTRSVTVVTGGAVDLISVAFARK